MSYAILNGADLTGAIVTNAKLSETIFADTNLTDVIGLEKCFHFGSSVIDHRTLRKSESLPISFLRGVGLPEHLIENLLGPSDQVNQAIEYYSCFISYSSEDEDFAKRIHAYRAKSPRKSNVLVFQRVTEARRHNPLRCRERLGGLLRCFQLWSDV